MTYFFRFQAVALALFFYKSLALALDILASA